jgi:hypothetical protein
VSNFYLAERSVLRTRRASASLGIAAGLFVGFFTTCGFVGSSFGEIISCLQPVAGTSGVYSDTGSYSIADINAAGGIVVGDKRFDLFSVTSSSSKGAFSPTAEDIEITGVRIAGDEGFRVNALWTALAGKWVDTTITYRASLVDARIAQGHAIVGNALFMTAVGGKITTGGIASISEDLYANHPGEGESSFAEEFAYYVDSDDNSVSEAMRFTPITHLWVVKDIGVSGGDGKKGVMALSEFYQTFRQAPEPSTLVLAGIGAIGLAGFVWRKRR